MRYKDIITNETLRMGNFDKIAKKYVNQNINTWRKNSKYIGDIEQYNVKKYQYYFCN